MNANTQKKEIQKIQNTKNWIHQDLAKKYKILNNYTDADIKKINQKHDIDIIKKIESDIQILQDKADELNKKYLLLLDQLLIYKNDILYKKINVFAKKYSIKSGPVFLKKGQPGAKKNREIRENFKDKIKQEFTEKKQYFRFLVAAKYDIFQLIRWALNLKKAGYFSSQDKYLRFAAFLERIKELDK